MKMLTTKTLERLKTELRSAFPDTSFQFDSYLRDSIPDHIAKRILAEGYLEPEQDSLLQPGEPSMCHENSIRLFESSPGWELWAGFALSPDGIWRWHWWARNERGQLVETTVRRIVYLGLMLGDRNLKPRFARAKSA